jgi:hypothetical protein
VPNNVSEFVRSPLNLMIHLLKLLSDLLDRNTPAVFVIGSSTLTQHNTNGSFLWFWCASPARTGKPKEITRRPLNRSGSKACQHGTMAGGLLSNAGAVIFDVAIVLSAIHESYTKAFGPRSWCS